MTWKVKRGETEYECQDTETLKKWASEGLVAVDDYIFNPVLNQWLYARDVAEVQGLFSKKVKNEKAKTLHQASIGLGIAGALFFFIAPPLGVLCLVGAVICAVMHHVQAGTVV